MEFAGFRFVFYTHQFERSVEFYEQTLEMNRVSGWDRPDSRGALLQATPTTIVEVIGIADQDPRAVVKPEGLVLMLRTDDADRMYARLVGSGADVDGPPEKQAWGDRLFAVRDPDGVVIHIHSQ
jgi:uncharacterized glyoxalase superfamily protein PhnB